MNANLFAENPDCMAYESLLIRLQELTVAGRGESAEANNVRDRMDAPWLGLSRAEREWVGGMSADLYMLSDEEIPETSDPSERGADTLGIDLLEARHRGDWALVLKLLRKGPIFFPKPTIAFLRGLGYLHLGHPRVAVLFFDHAAKLSPQDESYRVFSLDLLKRLGNHDDALARARCYIANPSTGLSLAVRSASEVFRSTRSLNEDEASPAYEELIALLDNKLRPPDQLGCDDPESTAFGYLLLGACLESVGNYQEALSAYDSSAAVKLPASAAANPVAPQAFTAKDALLNKMRETGRNPSDSSAGSARYRDNRFRIVLTAEPAFVVAPPPVAA